MTQQTIDSVAVADNVNQAGEAVSQLLFLWLATLKPDGRDEIADQLESGWRFGAMIVVNGPLGRPTVRILSVDPTGGVEPRAELNLSSLTFH